eukprot:PITA_31599
MFVSQGKYANEILRRFHMESYKPMETPLAGNGRKEDATSGEVVEATLYRKLVGSFMYLVKTRPDLCYEVNQLSQVMVRPTKMESIQKEEHIKGDLQYWANDNFFVQHETRLVALSFAEAEYMAASQETCETIWMRKILVGLFGQKMDLTVIYCNNHSCVKLSENPVFHDRSKHIDM